MASPPVAVYGCPIAHYRLLRVITTVGTTNFITMNYSKIQYISSGDTVAAQYERIQSALERGIDWVQLRFKKGAPASVLALAKKVKALQQHYDFTFIINDHLDIAEQVDADGVHLGLQDLPIARARQVLGDDKIIGGTANNYEDVLQRIDEGCDYIGLGPLRFTPSKDKLSPILGTEGYKQIIARLSGQQHTPIYAIGGVTYDDITTLTHLGLYGVAMSVAIEQQQEISSI